MSIKIENLQYIYGLGTPFEKKAIDNINITIEDGQFIGLIGHTGSGKSTFIQHLNVLIQPTKGSIILDGVDITAPKVDKKSIRQKVGLVFQYPEHQLFEMTVYKDVAFGPTNLGLSKNEIDTRVKDSLSQVGLDENIYEKSPFELSGGQKRRVAIAGVLAMKPKVLILDEPTAGLDPRGRDEILNKVKELHDSMKITVILVSHSMEDVAKYVDRLMVMNDGNIKLDGTPKEVFSHVEELESMGLGVPKVTYLMKELRQKGFKVPDNIINTSEAVETIKQIIKAREK